MRFLAVVLCLLLPLTVCAQTQPQANAGQPTGTINVDEPIGEDQAITRRIREILAELDGYDKVNVAVSSGIVTLTGTTLDSKKTQQLTELAGRIQGVVAVENNVTETTDVGERLNPVVDRFKSRVMQALSFLPLLLIALAVFALIIALGFFVARWRRPWNRLAPNGFIADIYRQIIRVVFVIAALVVALDILGATALLSGILGAAGIVGLAIGFAVRDTVENFIASIMLSVRQPFRPNDTVEIEGDTGKVIRLTSRATILLSFDGNHIRIPNATVFKSRIVNFSRNPERRFTFELGMAPDTAFDAAAALALQILRDLPFTLETPEPGVWIETIGDSTVSLQMAAWINQEATSIGLARSEAIRLVMSAFDKAGHRMPEPTYRIIYPPQTTPQDTRPDAEPQPHKASLSTRAAKPVQDVKATADKALEEFVDQERAETERDLLSRNGTVE